jgi:germination protein M
MERGKVFLFVLVFLLLCGSLGCGKEPSEESAGGRIYFLNGAETQLVSEGYELKATFKEAQVQEYVNALAKEPEGRELKKLLPENVKLLDFSFGEADQLILNFDANYSTLTGITEVLIRAALVKTFCQIEGVDYVEFYVNGIPYMIGELPVGMMKAEDFIDNTSDEEFYTQMANVSIYFANEDGTALRESHRQVSYNSNISMEQLVVEQLIGGPIEEERAAGLCATIPEDTQLSKISTKDGICYLDLSVDFLEKPEGIREEIILYSIVNSLAELPNVNKVQIRIGGELRKSYQSFEMPEVFERDLDLIETEM